MNLAHNGLPQTEAARQALWFGGKLAVTEDLTVEQLVDALARAYGEKDGATTQYREAVAAYQIAHDRINRASDQAEEMEARLANAVRQKSQEAHPSPALGAPPPPPPCRTVLEP